MFCDVSGFTKLAEAMAKSGMGAEGLAKYLNQVSQRMLVHLRFRTLCAENVKVKKPLPGFALHSH